MPWSQIAPCARIRTTSGCAGEVDESVRDGGKPRPHGSGRERSHPRQRKIPSVCRSSNAKAWARGCSLMPRAPAARQRSPSAKGFSAGSRRQKGSSGPRSLVPSRARGRWAAVAGRRSGRAAEHACSACFASSRSESRPDRSSERPSSSRPRCVCASNTSALLGRSCSTSPGRAPGIGVQEEALTA